MAKPSAMRVESWAKGVAPSRSVIFFCQSDLGEIQLVGEELGAGCSVRGAMRSLQRTLEADFTITLLRTETTSQNQ